MSHLFMVIGAALALAIVSQQGCDATWSRTSYEYLNLPTSEQIGKYRELQDIKSALFKIAQASGSTKDPSVILAKINKLREETQDYLEMDVYDEILSVSDKTDTCTGSFVKYVVDILGIMENSKDGSLTSLEIYLSHYGQDKFSLCAERFEHEFEQTRWNSDVEKELDEYFGLLLGLGGRASDLELYDRVARFDMARDNFQTGPLIKFLKEKSNLQQPGYFPTKEQLVLHYLPGTSAKLLKPLERGLNVINLAHDLAGYRTGNAKLMKFNEYNRISLSMTKPERRPVTEANVKRVLG